MKKCLVLVALAACGDDGNHTVDGAPLAVMGEYVDFDSTDTGFFCGIFGATFTVHGDPTQTNMTNPNGRFQLMIHDARTQVDITPPTAQSECTTPKSTYNVPGIMIIDEQVVAAQATLSARSFTVDRAPMFNYDSTKAQVLIHVDGAQRAVSIDAAHDATQAFNGATWAAGDVGTNIYFPNVDPSAGTTNVSVAGGAVGTGSIPLAAGTFTYLTVHLP
jgi:hypothetical protein